MKQWKRKAAAIFAAATLCGALPANALPVQNLLSGVVLTAHADDTLSGYCGDRQVNDGKNVTWKLENGVLTISGKGAMAHFSMLYYNNSDDFALSTPWFDLRQSISGIVIEEGVTHIGNSAFEECRAATSVSIPDSVTSIGTYAFRYCESLTSVTIPDSVTSIGGRAFYDCSSLTSITISDSVTSIEEKAFQGCSSLTSITIPSNVTSIGDGALYCTSLTEINVDQQNSTYCSDNGILFSKNKTQLYTYPAGKSETAYAIPDSVTSIGDNAFYGCTSLASVTIPDSVTSIGIGAFNGCSSLTSITIPDSVTSIGSSIFINCTNLTSVTLPNNVSSISISAFSGCYSLTDVTIPDSVTSIGSFAFQNCSSLTDVTIPDRVTSIGIRAFNQCTNLISVIIPASVKSIGGDAFYGCTRLASVIMEGETPPELGTYVFYLPDNKTIYVPSGSVETYRNADSWYYYKNIITSNGTVASGTCGDLNENNGENVTWTLGKGILTISGTGKIASFLQNPSPWAEYRSAIQSVVIESGVTGIGNSAFAQCSCLNSVTIPDSVTSIGVYAFDGCSSLKSVTIPDSVTSIGAYAFDGCSSLGSVTIPDGVVSIDAYTFKGCSSLTAFTIPANVTSIGGYAFSECTNLASITIPNSVTSLGEYAFSGCSSLASATIPDSMITIGKDAFSGCSSLTTITIPASVTSIGGNAFNSCSGLATVFMKKQTPPTIGDSVFENTSDALMIYVPTASVETYQNITKWSSYKDHIFPVNPSGFCGDPEENNGENVTWALNDDGVLTISGTGDMADYLYNVTSIPWNDQMRLIKSVVIEKGVTHIGSGAFVNCSMTSITIPDGVTSLGEYAFSGCTNLTSATIPVGVTDLGEGAFDSCSSLRTVSIPNGVKGIGDTTFYGCTSLTTVTIPGSVKWIDMNAFMECTSLTSVEILEGVEGIANQAFYKCKNLTSVTLPKSMKEICDWAFFRCGLTSVTIPESVTNIGYHAFEYCPLTTVTIPKNVENISLGAFANTKLTSVTIAEGVKSIDKFAFQYCESLTSVVIPESMISIGDMAFFDCPSLTSVTIPKNVTSLGASAFSRCSSLKSVLMKGETPPALGGNPFSDTHNDLKIYVPALSGGAYKNAWNTYEDRIIEYPVLKEEACYPVDSNGANKVHVGFKATVPLGKTIEDYGLIYYNSGNVIHTEHLTLENVGVSGIKKASYYSANITDKGYGVTAVGFIKLRDETGAEETYYTGELGGSFEAMTNAAKYVKLTKQENKAVVSGGKQKVYVGFDANVPNGYTVEDYGLIYYNSGNVIHTEHLTLENVGICGINKAKYWGANITDNGYGVTAVGFVKIKDALGNETVIYSEELGGSYAAISKAAAEKAVNLTRQQNKAVVSGGKNKVYVGFNAKIAEDYTVKDYGLIYYNSGNVIHTEHLTLDNVGICGISQAKYWGANITDIGYGVTAVGFVTVEDANGNVYTRYTEELGGSFTAISEAAAANAVTLTRQANKAVVSGGKNKVYVGFNANVADGYTVEDYGLIYYNSGNVIHTEHLTLGNVGVCGITKAKYWGANITDNGYGVTAVGFVKVKDANGYVTTLYTGELGAKFAELPH